MNQMLLNSCAKDIGSGSKVQLNFKISPQLTSIATRKEETRRWHGDLFVTKYLSDRPNPHL